MSDMDRDNDDYFNGPEIKVKIKIKLKFKDNKFYVNCLQCRNLVSYLTLFIQKIMSGIKFN